MQGPGEVLLPVCCTFTENLFGLGTINSLGKGSNACTKCCPKGALDTASSSLRTSEGKTYAGKAYVLQQLGIANTCFSYARNL